MPANGRTERIGDLTEGLALPWARMRILRSAALDAIPAELSAPKVAPLDTSIEFELCFFQLRRRFRRPSSSGERPRRSAIDLDFALRASERGSERARELSRTAAAAAVSPTDGGGGRTDGRGRGGRASGGSNAGKVCVPPRLRLRGAVCMHLKTFLAKDLVK